jgi:ABC-type multidrug transport system ATPase subunit
MISVQVQNIKKSYGETLAVENINFDVHQAELFGLIGPDGAGKTTIFRILTSLILPDEGKAVLNGYDVIQDYKKIRQIIGYMPGRFSLYQDLTVEENLNFFATVFGTTIEENYDLIRDIYIQIEPFKKRRAGKLSGGMKQKLALSCALIHKPEILILDEPTTGVDAVSRKEFWDMLKRLREKGITILVSTPYMDEASLCDRVALIQKGKIMQIDTPQKITDSFEFELISLKSDNIYKLLQDLRAYPKTHSVFPFGQTVHYTSKSGKINIGEINEYLQNKNHKNIKINKIKANIEDCFMELMT